MEPLQIFFILECLNKKNSNNCLIFKMIHGYLGFLTWLNYGFLCLQCAIWSVLLSPVQRLGVEGSNPVRVKPMSEKKCWVINTKGFSKGISVCGQHNCVLVTGPTLIFGLWHHFSPVIYNKSTWYIYDALVSR